MYPSVFCYFGGINEKFEVKIEVYLSLLLNEKFEVKIEVYLSLLLKVVASQRKGNKHLNSLSGVL